MSAHDITFTLSFEGQDSDAHAIDFYDVSQALIGFQRSLALTTHLILNGKIITQAPSLEGGRILLSPPEDGSWKIDAKVAVLASTLLAVGVASRDSLLGNLLFSAYDYVMLETVGIHGDYSKSIGQLYEEAQKKKKAEELPPIVKQSQLDSLIEKCEANILQIHRPIVFSETATTAKITFKQHGKETPIGNVFDQETYAYISQTRKGLIPEEIEGKVSSYNINTYKGRIFVPDEGRPIPFEQSESAKDAASVEKVIQSLTMNSRDRFGVGGNSGILRINVLKYTSRTGRLKSHLVLEVL